jgi:outer membrane protein TolC
MRFKILRDFMVREGLKQAPELRALRAGIEARDAEVGANQRELYIPSFGLPAGTTHRLYQGGAGTEEVTLPAGMESPFPSPNDFDWFVGVTASLPLYEGGARYADLRQAEHELAKLEIEKEDAQRLIEQRIRSALHQAGASYPAIKLSRDAASAARDNLELTTDAYNKGAASIVVLLDAQNQSLVSDLAAANAAYAFLADLMMVERATGSFDFFITPEQRRGFFARLKAYTAGKRDRAGGASGK